MDETRDTHLLELPRETRDQIYGYLFATRGCTPFNPGLAQPKGIEYCKCRDGTKLLRVCRQLRSECLPIFYRSHTIRIVMHGKRIDKVRSWISMIGEPAFSNIRRLQIKGFPIAFMRPKSEHMIVIDMNGHSEDDGEIAKLVNQGHRRESETQGLELVARARFEQVQACLRELPVVQGKPVMTKLKLEQVLRISGWSLVPEGMSNLPDRPV